MNCLLLLVILFCCGQGKCASGNNGGRNLEITSGNNGCEHNFTVTNMKEKCCEVQRERQSDCGCVAETEPQVACGCRETERESNRITRVESERESSCDCRLEREGVAVRPHYPYLELEPRTCGCEEK